MTKLHKEIEVEAGASIIRDGGIVAFRTETVYGLGADATNAEAVAKVFEAKGRPADNPLIVHFASLKHLRKYFPNIDDDTVRVFDNFKRALTVVLPKPEQIPDIVTGGKDSVAVRIPGCFFARRFIKRCGVPIAAPSANTTSRPSPTSWQDVYEDLNKKIDAIFMGRSCKYGIESTVIKIVENDSVHATSKEDLRAKILVLRLGSVDVKSLAKKMKMKVEVLGDSPDEMKIRHASPGTRFKHYAPSCPVITFPYDDSMSANIISYATEQINLGKSLVILSHSSNRYLYPGIPVMHLGWTARRVAKSLFSTFRVAEKGADLIICEMFPNTLAFAAVNERITKASQKGIDS